MDIRIAAYGIITRGSQILLAHWNEHGRDGWTLPGGGIEAGEHPADAAKREIFEETGYHAEIEELIGVDRMIVPPEQRHSGADAPLYALRVIYRARIIGGELRAEVGGSSDEARWIELDEVPALKRVSLLDIGLELYRTRPQLGRVSTD